MTQERPHPVLLLGCDFSSAPMRRKPIVVAIGKPRPEGVELVDLLEFASLDDWERWLADTPEWIGAFDLPFGLPRELVVHLGWPLKWEALIGHYAKLSRASIRDQFAAFCAARPVGSKFAHRATDGPAGSSPSMKWVNPPVAFMLHAGVPRLLAAGATFPGLHKAAQSGRIALEGYPGLWARRAIGRRSYKSDTRASQTPERCDARVDLVAAMEAGLPQNSIRLRLSEVQRADLVNEPQGDKLDAALCLMQAAWAAARADSPGPGHGLPSGIDSLEGWIVGV